MGPKGWWWTYRGVRISIVFCWRTRARAFYFGQTGIRLNALIKLLTWFERPVGQRVFDDESATFFVVQHSLTLSSSSRRTNALNISTVDTFIYVYIYIFIYCHSRYLFTRLFTLSLSFSSFTYTIYFCSFSQSTDDHQCDVNFSSAVVTSAVNNGSRLRRRELSIIYTCSRA